MHFYGWKRGLKTGIYYLRTRPSANAIQFTIDAGTSKREFALFILRFVLTIPEVKDNAAAAKIANAPVAPAAPSAESLVAPLKQVSIATTASAAPVPSPSVSISKSAATASRPESPGPSEEEEISYEEAKRRADERAEAALQCSIDNKDACMMCSG